MSQEEPDRALIGLLHYGTWAASGVIAVGMIAQAVAPAVGANLINAGILLFILLPVCRVVLMLVGFAGKRNYRLAALAALVLTIITISCWVGEAHGPRPAKARVSPLPTPGGRLPRTG